MGLITKQLYEQRAKVKKQMEDVIDSAKTAGTDIPQEKMIEFNKWGDEMDAITEQIKQAEINEKRLSDLSQPLTNQDVKTAVSDLEKQKIQLKDFSDLLRVGEKKLSPERLAEIRANQFYKGTTTAGGYLVPTLMGDRIAAAEKFVGGMLDRSLCTWIQSSTGSAVTFPTVDDTSVKGYVIAEKTAMVTSASDMTFGQSTLTYYKITSGHVRVSNELLQDSAFDFVGWLTDMLFKRMFRGLNYYFTQGTGTSMPYGINKISTKGEDATVRGITRDDILNLMYSVNRAYQMNGTFMFNNSTMKAIRALYIGSADARSLYQVSMREGEPSTLEGRPFVVNDDVSDLHPTYRPVFFGDFKNFYIGECLPMQVKRADELWIDTDEVGFVVIGRWASNLISGGVPIKHLRNAKT
jgi:HK97 family phage major capsid protein